MDKGIEQTRHKITSEGKRKERQKELAEELNQRARERLAFQPGSSGAKASKKSNVSYKSREKFPDNEDEVRKLQLFVDKRQDSVIVPIFGMPVPFHISMIKNISSYNEGDFTYLRINFQHPGSNNGKDNTFFPNPLETFLKELTFRASNIKERGKISAASTNLITAFWLIKEMQKKFRTQEAENREKEEQISEDQRCETEEKEIMAAMGLPTEFGPKMKCNNKLKNMYIEWCRKTSLSFEERRMFDFRFDPRRDLVFIARKAEKFFDYEFTEKLKKYWFQRYSYFSKLDDGVLMDRESWFSVTPEELGEHIADRLVQGKDTVILDGFCGAGGNSIQFALKGAIVYAVDLDPMKLMFARENSKIYGVEDRINFICGDFFHLSDSLSRALIDIVFLSPPWGGPAYLKKENFRLENMTPNGIKIFEKAYQISSNIVYFLPRNTCIEQLRELSDGKVEIERNLIEYNINQTKESKDGGDVPIQEKTIQKCKSLTVYYGIIAKTFEHVG